MADLRSLERWLIPWAEALVLTARQAGWNVIVTSTRRSRLKQAELRRAYETGASPFPAAKPGCSIHEHGLAFDLVVTGRAGKGIDHKKLAALGRLWESWGGVWGGRWSRADPVHFQPPGVPPRLC